MPFRENTLDNGFTDPIPRTVELPKPEDPSFFGSLALVGRMLNPATAAQDAPITAPVAGAAFRMDNAVVNAWQMLTRPDFKPDPTFDVKAALERDGLWDNYRDNFLDVRSQAEYDYITGKISQENKDRETIGRAGPAGLVMAMGAGVADPTSLMPFIGQGKGVFAILKSAALGGTAALIDEIPLQANQETRTAADTGFSIAGGTVLGGLLGGAAVLVRRGAGESIADALDGLAKRMDGLPDKAAIPTRDPAAIIADINDTHKVLNESKWEGITRPPVSEIPIPPDALRQARQLELQPAWNIVRDEMNAIGDAINSGELPASMRESFNAMFVAGPHGPIIDETRLGQFMDKLGTFTDNIPDGKAAELLDNAQAAWVHYSNEWARVDPSIRKNWEEQITHWRNAEDSVSPLDSWIEADAEARANPNDEFLQDWKREPIVIEALKVVQRERDMRDAANRVLSSRYMEAQRRLEELYAEQEARLRHITDEEVDGALTTAAKPNSVGAAAIERDAGSLKGMLGIGERLTRIAGPVTSNLAQRVSSTIRQMTAELSTAGLRLEKNVILDREGNVIGSIPSNQGGTVESIIQSRRAEVLDVLNKSYENYADYVFGPGESTKPFRNTRAAIAGQMQRRAKIGPQAKMNRREFFEAVGEAMLHGDQHPIPQVANTAREHRVLYNRLFEEAKSVGLIPEDIQLLGDTSFLNRIYNQDAIERNPNRFLELLTNHMESELQKDFAKVREGYLQAQGRDQQRLADMTMPLEEAKALRKKFEEELKALDSMEDDDVGPIEDLISSFRSEAVARAKQINKLTRANAELPRFSQEWHVNDNEIARLTDERQAFRDEIDKLQQVGGPDLEARAQRRAELKRRMRNLNRNQYFVEEKYRKKFDTIEALEEQSIETMNRAIRSGHKALNEIDAISDKSQQSIERASKALDGVVDQWVALGNRIEALKAKPANADLSLENPDLEVAKLLDLQGKQDTTLQRLRDAQDNLKSIQNIDRTENGVADARGAVQEALDATVEKLTELNARRAKRMAKLEKDAAKFDKKAWEARVAEVRDRMQTRATTTHDRLHSMGADDADLEAGTANFKQHAREIAEAAMDKIQGTNVRLPGFDAMQSERGTELARTLTIPSEQLTPYGFLMKDAEHLIHAYANTLIPDIEIVRRFGLFAPDGNLNPMFKAINEEEKRVLDMVQRDFEAKAAKAGKPVDEAAMGKLLKDTRAEFNLGRENIRAIIMRLRHQWGVPNKPNGFYARGVNIIMGLQAMRLLGMVTVNSVMDVARPIMRYGLQRTVMNAWVPMINNWKAVRMSMREAQRAFVAVETMTADRAHQVADLMQNAQRRSMGEAALEWGVSKIGIVAGFSPWTDVMKTLSFMVQSSKVLDSLELALRGGGTKAERAEAVEYLASLGWDNVMQERIWKQIEAGGGEKIKGTWVPQTERWTDPEAVRSFRAAANQEAASTIITPGVEIPKFMNASPFMRLLLHLKSFGMASTSKTLMAALQQRDMAVLNGVMISLALGALSKYLGAQIAGGTSLDHYNAMTPQQHIQEAIDQSGLLGAIGYAAQLASDMTAGPATGDLPHQKFLKSVRDVLGAYNITDPASAIIGDIAGPSAQLTQLTLQAVTSGKWTPAEIHRVRQLLPLQNVFYLRKLFDAVENAVGGNRP